MSHAVIITIYKKDRTTIDLCSQLYELGAEHIIVVNDGCITGDEYFNELISIGCHILTLEKGSGKGTCIKAGAKYAYENIYNITGFITADADGQHRAEDIMRVSRALEIRPDNLILGKRDISKSKMSFGHRIGHKAASAYFKVITGVKCKDTMTGLRGIPVTLYDIVINTKGQRFEYEMNFLTKCADLKVPFYNVNIVTNQPSDSASNYRLFKDTFLIYRTPLRFATASMGCTIVDLVLFTVFTYLLPASIQWNVALATLMARVVSGCMNFLINRKVIFDNDSKAGNQALKFFILFFFIMCASTVTVSALSFIPVPATLIKAIVDLLLWAVNYTIQRKWVFKET